MVPNRYQGGSYIGAIKLDFKCKDYGCMSLLKVYKKLPESHDLGAKFRSFDSSYGHQVM